MRKTLGMFVISFLTTTILLCNCGFGRISRDKTAGDNLSFETVKNGLPVNWYFNTAHSINQNFIYTPKEKVDFDIAVIDNNAKEGNNYLKFTVRKCGPGLRTYPGIFNEFEKSPGKTFRVGFWVKNKGCKYKVIVSAVRPKGGGPCKTTIVCDSVDNEEWRHLDLDQHICPSMDRLRFEVQILTPGTFMIDGISIDEQNPMKL